MADSDDEDELLVTFAVTAVAAAAATFMLDAAATTRQRKRRHRVWVNKYLQRRAQYGTYNSHFTTICLRKFVTSQVRHQNQLSDWLRRYNKSTTNRIQTPLLRFVVDLLWTRICCTTNPQQIE